MPLNPKKNKKAVSENIEELISTGRSQKQSVAIALNKAGMSKKNKKAKGKNKGKSC